MRGEVAAYLRGRVVRLHPSRRVATVALRSVGRGASYRGQYVAPTSQIAPVTDGSPLGPPRQLGRVVKVDPTAGGAELSLIIGDDDAWLALAAGAAKVDVQVLFERGGGGDPVGGRPLRVVIV